MAEQSDLTSQGPSEDDLSAFGPEEQELIKSLGGGKAKYVRMVLAAIGSIPWFGLISIGAGIIGAAGGFAGDRDQEKAHGLLRLWIQEHRNKAAELAGVIKEITARLDGFGEQIDARIKSPEYLTLVRMTFRSWDDAETRGKRDMFKKLIVNAAVDSGDGSIDDLITLFINWVNRYHDTHFLVIRELYRTPNLTRGEIWDRIHPSGRPREDSAQAGLYRYLISELSIGGIIEQAKVTDHLGRRLRATTPHRSPGSSPFLISAFEDGKEMVLTELGKQFVHYVLDDAVSRLGTGSTGADPPVSE